MFQKLEKSDLCKKNDKMKPLFQFYSDFFIIIIYLLL